MKVKCISNKIKDLLPFNAGMYRGGTELEVTPGKEYNVYAIELNNNSVWYYIAGDDYSDDVSGRSGYPHPASFAAELFVVVDNRPSKTWLFTIMQGENGVLNPLFAFPEWINDPYDFYEGFYEWDVKQLEIFNKYKKIIDAEY